MGIAGIFGNKEYMGHNEDDMPFSKAAQRAAGKYGKKNYGRILVKPEL